MEQTDIITRYFPGISDVQRGQFDLLGTLYPEWNERINVISRKDIGELYTRHILHSLAIARFLGPLKAGTTFMDLGTGGGFPAIPLAIFYPQCSFHLVDRIAKKLRVASEVAREAGITNITVQHGDAGECHSRFDYVVSRAVMPLDGLLKIASRNVARSGNPGAYPPGLICLKGGDLSAEIAACRRNDIINIAISDYFSEPFFETKEIIYVPL